MNFNAVDEKMKAINILILFGTCLLHQASFGQQLDYSPWATLLQKHVSLNGMVDYEGFYGDKANLTEFTDYLTENTPKASWSDNQRKAYLINLYNANTVRLIVDHYPVKSIKDIVDGLSNVFKHNFIDFDGEKISLDDVEKKMLLPMGDARVHFAINCASKSCPKLANYAFDPERLDKQLDQVTKDFINSSHVEVVNGKVLVSKIFKWYESDFEQASGSVIKFINAYAENKINADLKINYLDYSWDLNGTNQ